MLDRLAVATVWGATGLAAYYVFIWPIDRFLRWRYERHVYWLPGHPACRSSVKNPGRS